MKINTIQRRVLTLVTSLMIFSCTSNDNELGRTEMSTADVQDMLVANDVTTTIDNILEDDDYDYALLGRGASLKTSSIADCVVRTIIESNSSKTVTLDFGERCIGYHGKELSGKVVIEYTKTTDGYSKDVKFIDFYIEGHNIIGSKSIVKVKENANGNHEATHAVGIEVVFSDASTVSLSGTRIREMVAGKDTRTRGDDSYSITGHWVFINRDGERYAGTVIENLRREFSCRYVVSGIVEISRNETHFQLDFGDGSCDNIGVLTDRYGTSREIALRR